MKELPKGPMTDAEKAARDRKRGYSDSDLEAVLDNPEWTDEELKSAKPFAEVFPELAASIARDNGATIRRLGAEPRPAASASHKAGKKTARDAS